MGAIPAIRDPGRVPPEIRRLFVRGVNWLGDAVMTTPALQRLRERFPSAHICLATQSKLAGLWGGHPAVDELLVIEPGESLWSVGQRLRGGSFDAGLALPNSHRAALEMWLAGVPARYGLGAPWRSLFLTHAVRPRAGAVKMFKPAPARVRRLLAEGAAPALLPSSSHHVFHYLHLAAALGADPTPTKPRLQVSPDEVEAVRLQHGLLPGVNWLALNPGAEYGPAKRWPVERFAAVAIEACRASGCRCVILGGRGDVGLAAVVEEKLRGAPGVLPGLNLAGRTSLRELCAVLRACRVLLTNDTGPMHLGAALGVSVVALFGSTSPELTGPGLPGEGLESVLRQPAPCSPCFLRECPVDFRCMQDLTVETVVAAVLSRLR